MWEKGLGDEGKQWRNLSRAIAPERTYLEDPHPKPLFQDGRKALKTLHRTGKFQFNAAAIAQLAAIADDADLPLNADIHRQFYFIEA